MAFGDLVVEDQKERTWCERLEGSRMLRDRTGGLTEYKKDFQAEDSHGGVDPGSPLLASSQLASRGRRALLA